MANQKMLKMAGRILAVMLCVAIIPFSSDVEAKTKIVALEGVSYNVNSSLTDNLKSLSGKMVYVTLDSGKTFGGFIKVVGEHLIHIEKIVGKDLFDALIRIEDISAIDTKFRDIQR